ncbi:hypothetical protein [Fluviicola sp.]|uniref:SecDF P1 head subdomain-containing protein n=1 Tax=Fluviicola sp. TaxID=1917219 RepID=UPI0031D8468C
MKCIPLLLLLAIFSCSSGSKPRNLKNAKPGKLEFFETYTFSEIAPSWDAACKWVHEQDTVAMHENIPLTENPRGLTALVRPHTNFMIGYVKAEDLLEVETLLALPEVKAKFPKNLRFMFSYREEDIQNYHKMYALYAIKVPESGKAIIDGRHIENAEAAIADYNGMPVIRITMNDQGAHDWEVMTRRNIGRAIAISVNDHVISCPVVNSVITGGETEISGNFTKAQAEELAAGIYLGKK